MARLHSRISKETSDVENKGIGRGKDSKIDFLSELELAINSKRDLSIWDTANIKGTKISRRKKVFGDISYGDVEEAINESSGMITRVALRLSISTYHVKGIFAKYKTLGRQFEEFRDSILDEVECHLMNRIRDKADVTAMIFLLKCLGKGRGWIDSAGSGSAKKAAVRMKIVPAKGNVVPFRKVANGQEE